MKKEQEIRDELEESKKYYLFHTLSAERGLGNSFEITKFAERIKVLEWVLQIRKET